MARATREQSEQTGRQVLTVARDLFAEKGFTAVGLEEVAAAAGVTRGAVYHHYRSKAGLFEAVAAAAQAEVAAAVAVAADGAADEWAGLLAGCRAFLVAGLDDARRRILLIDAPAVLGWAVWREQDSAASGRLLAAGLAALHDRGVIAVTSIPGAVAAISGALNESALHIAAAPDRAAALELTWPDLERLLDGLRPAGASRP